MMFIRVSRVNVLIWYFALVQEGAPFKAQQFACASHGLAQAGIFEDLNENLPARAARENLRKFACPESGP